jgi:GTPase SAR1 family protein
MTARKIMLLGEIGVGKSSIARRLVFDRFEGDYKPTIGVDVYSYDVDDGAGEEGSSLGY